LVYRSMKRNLKYVLEKADVWAQQCGESSSTDIHRIVTAAPALKQIFTIPTPDSPAVSNGLSMKTLHLETTPSKRPLGNTGLRIGPLALGGNVFGWTVDQPTSFALLDHFVDAGLNAIDTADAYSAWVPGHKGGESETVLGNWFKADSSHREKTVLITKVGIPLGPGSGGLSAKHIVTAVENSLRRLQTHYIDLYLSHRPDAKTPVEDTLGAYEALLRQGKVKAVGASNHSAQQLRQALDVASTSGLPRYQVLQPEYNLYDRSSFEGELRDLCVAEGLGVITYYGLASGFLTGKYRNKNDLGKSARGASIDKYLNPRGQAFWMPSTRWPTCTGHSRPRWL
jgi:aryl-alcohol dehydrogenase-like predicted oxidoreductase